MESFKGPGSDYSAVNTELRFSSSDVKPCASIPIFDDLQIEQEESFFVAMERTESMPANIGLIHHISEVLILENDCKSGYLHRFSS